MFRLLTLQLENNAADKEAELLQQLYGSHYSTEKKQLSLELVDSVGS
jgi:hypothetical protein